MEKNTPPTTNKMSDTDFRKTLLGNSERAKKGADSLRHNRKLAKMPKVVLNWNGR